MAISIAYLHEYQYSIEEKRIFDSELTLIMWESDIPHFTAY